MALKAEFFPQANPQVVEPSFIGHAERLLCGGAVYEKDTKNGREIVVITHDRSLQEIGRDRIVLLSGNGCDKLKIERGDEKYPYKKLLALANDTLTFAALDTQNQGSLTADYSTKDGLLQESIAELKVNEHIITPPPQIPIEEIGAIMDTVNRIKRNYSYSLIGIKGIIHSFENFGILPSTLTPVQE